MPNMIEYLKWRGDILFTELPPNPVDDLIFSTLAYVCYDGIVSEDVRLTAPLRIVAKTLLALPDLADRCRVREDLEVLEAAAATERFGRLRVSFYRNVFVPEEDTQFAAIAFLLDDGTACLAFRGTDNSLVGWKEDFNMSFRDSVPAQRLAVEYVEEFAAATAMPLRLSGHSKGGNLAIYAAAKSHSAVQERIIQVYNHDGPGFREAMMTDSGYLAMVPRIHTYVPQSSVFGMMLNHAEPYTVIKSNQLGIMQHDPHSWEIMGRNFIIMEERTAGSHFLDRTLRSWLEGMTLEERNEFIDTVFHLLMAEGASKPIDLLKPQNLLSYFRTLQMDENVRNTIASVLTNLIQTAKDTKIPSDDP